MVEGTRQGKIGICSASHTGYAFWRSWLKHSATVRKVVGSISNGVVGIIHRLNPSCRTMTLGWIHPVTEMSTRCISWWCKGGRCVGLVTLPPSCAVCVEIPGTSNSCNPEGLSRPVQGLRNFECHAERLGEVQKLRNVQCSAVLLKIILYYIIFYFILLWC